MSSEDLDHVKKMATASNEKTIKEKKSSNRTERRPEVGISIKIDNFNDDDE